MYTRSKARCQREGCHGNLFPEYDSYTHETKMVCLQCGRTAYKALDIPSFR